MRSAHVLAVCALLLGALLASVGCYRPKNLSGGFSCPEGGACPDGTSCHPTKHICVSSYDAGVVGTGGKGGAAGTGGTAGTGGKGGQGGVDAGACTGAIASCPSSDAGMCDPVCNIGCGCHDKCSVNANGELTCNAPTTTHPPGLLGACAQMNFGSMQTDDCAPGQVCIAPRGDLCNPRCYQFCRTSSDCTNGASCSIDAGGGNTLCDVPVVPCDPVQKAAADPKYSNCSGNPFIGCYLSSDTLDTVCDCQDTPPSGSTGRALEPCTRSRDCFAGLICLDATGRGKQCRKVCRLPGDGGVDLTRADAGGELGCTNNDPTLCLPFKLANGNLSTTFGFCND